jgi:hypothetical protein
VGVRPTALDLFRLGVFATLNGGELPDVPLGVVDTYRRLAAATLVTLTEYDSPNWVMLSARITPEGQTVVEAMVAAGRATIENGRAPQAYVQRADGTVDIVE